MSEAKRAATDTKSAAERVRHMAQGIVTSFEAMEAMMPFLKSDGQDGVLDAAVAVARAYLSLVPADSDEVIDAEFLRSVGFDADEHQAEMNLPEFWHPDWPDERTRTSLIMHPDGTVFLSQGPDEAIQWPVPIKTRGDLRRLMSALGIPLTERPQ